MIPGIPMILLNVTAVMRRGWYAHDAFHLPRSLTMIDTLITRMLSG